MILTEVLDKFGVEYRDQGNEHCRPGWVQIDCPDCSPNAKRFRLGINIYRLNMNCWACGPKRRAEVLQSIGGVTLGQAIGIWQDVVPHMLPVTDRLPGELKMPCMVGNMCPAHHRYLTDRGFNSKHLAKVWGLRGIGRYGGEWSWRIFIPIRLHGEIVSWTTRSICEDHSLRYRSAAADEEKINHKTLLYGEENVPGHTIVIVEGPTDVWKVGPGSVATFGTGFKMEQVLRMSKYLKRVVCYDNEPEGQKRAAELVRLLAPFPGETFNVVLDAKDPGSARWKEIHKLRKAFLK